MFLNNSNPQKKMRRKVIQLAGKTFVVSLPSKWAKNQNIRKGDELDVIESDHSLIIAQSHAKKELKILLDVSELNSSLVWHHLVAAYTHGADEIELRFADKEIFNPRTQLNVSTIKFIAEVTDSLIGMELVKHGSNFCILKEVSSAKIEEFDVLLKRLFFNVCTFSTDCLTSIKNKDWFALDNCSYIEQNVNRLFIFCSRLLNRGAKNKNNESHNYQSLLVCLEEIADVYSEIAKVVSTNKFSEKDLKEFIAFFEKINSLVNSSYELFYNFDKQKCSLFYDSCRFLKTQENYVSNNKNNVLPQLLLAIEGKCMTLLTIRISLSI